MHASSGKAYDHFLFPCWPCLSYPLNPFLRYILQVGYTCSPSHWREELFRGFLSDPSPPEIEKSILNASFFSRLRLVAAAVASAAASAKQKIVVVSTMDTV